MMKLYLQIHLLIAAAYVLAITSELVLTRLAGTRIDLAGWTRACQGLLLAAILAPLAVSALPARSLPHIPYQAVTPLREGMIRPMRSMVRRKIRPTRMAPAETSSPAPDMTPERLELALEAVLMAVALALLARLLTGLIRTSRQIRRGTIVRNLGQVTIAVSDELAIPFSLRLLRAHVVLPSALVARGQDFRIAARHELQHHRQGDTAWVILMEILACAFWLNPFIHFWRRKISELQELSCDEALLGRRRISPRDYGSCLIRVAEAALGARRLPVGTAGMSASFRNPKQLKSFLGRRIEMLTEGRKPGGSRALWLMIGTLSVAATVATAYGTQREFRDIKEAAPASATMPQLDPEIQKIASDVLSDAVYDQGAAGGFALVSDPNTGKLLAATALRRKGDKVIWMPGVLSYRYEPASAIKTIVAAMATEKGKVAMDESFDCGNGNYRFGGHTYHDWTPMDHLTAAGTVMRSSNICGIRIGERLGSKGLAQALKDFGFGPGGAVDGFPGARSGVYPAPEQMDETDYIPLVSTGYTNASGFYVTPLEMVQAYGAIVNGGRLMRPLAATEPDSAATVIRQVLSEENANRWRKVLADAVIEGTGTHARSNFYTTGGKTSTAYGIEWPERSKLGGEISTAGFVGFAPAVKPGIVVLVGVVKPTIRVTGNRNAAPVFREIAERVLKHMKVRPDNFPEN